MNGESLNVSVRKSIAAVAIVALERDESWETTAQTSGSVPSFIICMLRAMNSVWDSSGGFVRNSALDACIGSIESWNDTLLCVF